MSEIPWQNYESNEKVPSIHKASPEEVKKRWEEIEYSNHLIKENDVLKKLDLQDEQEEEYRKTLENLDKKDLIDLASKSKSEILLFLTTNENQYSQKIETENNIEQKQDINSINEWTNQANEKISKLQSIFTPELLEKHSTLKGLFESLDNGSDKQEVFEQIISHLKDKPKTLASIVNEIWWPDKNNPQYQELKNTLIWIDSDFWDIFKELENLNTSNSLNTNAIIWDIEKESWWTLNIDISSKTAMSKMSLEDSSYSFDKEIDKQALNDLMEINQEELNELQNSFNTLKEFWVSFESLLTEIKQNWGKWDFKDILKNAVASFSKDIFSNLQEVYENTNIENSKQLKQMDITSILNIENPNDLKQSIDNIKNKFQILKTELWANRQELLKNYKTDVKELVDRKSEDKEKQLKVLEFLKASGFDLIPKHITDMIITELQSNSLIIPWLELNPQNIDLENWTFGESWAFIDKDWWINTQAKTNIVKFMNKLITWNIWEPLDINTIANGIWVVNPAKLKNDFVEAWIMGWVGWNIDVIRENLRNWNIT